MYGILFLAWRVCSIFFHINCIYLALEKVANVLTHTYEYLWIRKSRYFFEYQINTILFVFVFAYTCSYEYSKMILKQTNDCPILLTGSVMICKNTLLAAIKIFIVTWSRTLKQRMLLKIWGGSELIMDLACLWTGPSLR